MPGAETDCLKSGERVKTERAAAEKLPVSLRIGKRKALAQADPDHGFFVRGQNPVAGKESGFTDAFR